MKALNKENFYLASPPFFQKLLINLEGYRINKKRYPKKFDKILDEWISHEFFSYKELMEYRQKRLSILFKYANKVPYYHNVFLANGVDIHSKFPIKELRKIPVQNKATLKENMILMENGKKIFEDIRVVKTSGTTGSGFSFWRQAQAEYDQWAVWWRYRKLHSITRETWCGFFGGRNIIPSTQNKHNYYHIVHTTKQIIFSGYHLCENTIYNYYYALKKNR